MDPYTISYLAQARQQDDLRAAEARTRHRLAQPARTCERETAPRGREHLQRWGTLLADVLRRRAVRSA